MLILYYRALQDGPASIVVPIDKLSILVTVAFSWLVFREKLTANELPYGRAEPGHPVIVDYFYHEEVRGSENTGLRNR